jgi:heptosyltransferase-2
MQLERLEAAAPGVVRPREAPSLRLAFALAATADLLVCNTSMLMHVGAAFATPTLVLLGEDARSTLQHDRQWGYPNNYRALGKELPYTPRIASPVEAATAAEAMLTAGRAIAGGQASPVSSSAAR